MLKREALKGMRVEGVDLNNLVSSILEDYSYVLTAAYDASSDEAGEGIKRIGIKIPSESTSEFESKYQIHDLQLGEVSLVGVYKGEVQYADLRQNMINSAQAFSSEFESEPISKVIKSAKYSITQVEKNESKCSEGELLDYLDLIAIFQPVCFESWASEELDSEKLNNGNTNIEKKGVFARIKRWLKGE